MENKNVFVGFCLFEGGVIIWEGFCNASRLDKVVDSVFNRYIE